MIRIRFADPESERRGLAYLAGRFSFKTWANGDTDISESAFRGLAAKRIPFIVQGRGRQMFEPLRSALNVLRDFARPNVYVRPEDLAYARSLLNLACEAESIPYFLPMLFSGSAVASVIADAIQAVTVDASPSSLMRLTKPIQAAFDSYELHGKVSPRDVAELWPTRSGVQGLLSMHPSGYVREAAVDRLSAIHDGSELPFMMQRLNDWVEPVRDRAAAAVRDRTRPEYCGGLVRCLPRVRRLARQSRGKHEELISAVEVLVSGAHCLDVLKRAVHSLDRETRRYAMDLMLRRGDPEADRVRLELLGSDDTVMRLRAGRSITRHAQEAVLESVLPRLLSDRFMPVRREGLSAIPERATSVLHEALFDAHGSIREFARYHLKARGVVGFARFYREALAGPHRNLVSSIILGLAETGSAADAATLRAYLQDANPRTRAAAVYGVARLDGDSHIGELLTALKDESPRVSRGARDALQTRLYSLSAPSLDEVLISCGEKAHVIRNTVRLVALLNWWDAAPVLLRAATSANAVLRGQAAAQIEHAIENPNLLAALPSADQLRDFEKSLSEHRASLDVKTTKAFEQMVRWAHGMRR